MADTPPRHGLLRRAVTFGITNQPIVRVARAAAYVVNQNMAGIGNKLLGAPARAVSRGAGHVAQKIEHHHARNTSAVFGDHGAAARSAHHDPSSRARVASTMGPASAQNHAPHPRAQSAFSHVESARSAALPTPPPRGAGLDAHRRTVEQHYRNIEQEHYPLTGRNRDAIGGNRQHDRDYDVVRYGYQREQVAHHMNAGMTMKAAIAKVHRDSRGRFA